MNVSIDHPLIIPAGLAVLGLNVLCLVVLLLRPAPGKGRESVAQVARLLRAIFAEFLGTFALMLVALLSVLAPAAAGQPAPSLLVLAAVQGLALAALMAGPGVASGGHFNPAVTLGVMITGRLSVITGLGYLIAQCVGGILAGLLLTGIFGTSAVAATLPAPLPELPLRSIFVLEALACMVLMLALASQRHAPGMTPLAFGALLAVGILVIGPVTGGVLNPVRFLASAIVSSSWTQGIVYLAGPCIGCAVGGTLVQFFLLEPEEDTVIEDAEDEVQPPDRLAA